MRSALALVVFLAIGCGGTTVPVDDERGSGGSDTGAGAGGEGGSADAVLPTIEVLAPGGRVDTSVVTVRGVARDDRGVQMLWWMDRWNHRQNLPAAGEQELPFEFTIALEPGSHVVPIFAADAAGNRAAYQLQVTFTNPEALPPSIEFFEAERPWVEPDRQVLLRWQARGTYPMHLWLHPVSGGDLVEVTGRSQVEVGATRPDREIFEIYASNEFGFARAEVRITVGSELQIVPREATTVPNDQQPIAAPNAWEVDWSASGGSFEATATGILFQAREPGTYTVTATSREAEPRTATATITVAAITSKVAGLRSIGGQLAGVEQGFGVDASGTVWVKKTNGLLRRTGIDRWTLVEGLGGPVARTMDRLPNGDLIVLGEHLQRLPAGSDTWIVEELPLPDGASPVGGWIGEDGTLAIGLRYLEGGYGLLIRPPVSDSFEELSIPELMRPSAFAVDGAGGFYVAGRGTTGPRVLHRDTAGAWLDTGAIPDPNDLLVGADGRLRLAAHTTLRLGDEGWEPWSPLPECTPPAACGAFDLARRSDGSLLIVHDRGIVVEAPDGSFSEMEIPPKMAAGGLRSIREAPDGTLWALGDQGLFRLAPGDEIWVFDHGAGLPPNTRVADLIVEPDGDWILATNGDAGDIWGHHSLWHRDRSTQAWTGFGNELHTVHQPDPVLNLARADDGTIYGLIGYPLRAFAWNERLGSDEKHLPWDGRIANLTSSWWNTFDIGVASDGAIYSSGRAIEGSHVLRLDPGAEAWVEDSLLCADRFFRQMDGTLWAACGAPARQRENGSWEVMAEGLPPAAARVVDFAEGDDGSLLVTMDFGGGVHRLASGETTWKRLGQGGPSSSADRVASGGGRTWALTGDRIYELDPATQVWVPVSPRLPDASTLVFEATGDGSLLVGGSSFGLFQTVDADSL